MACLEMLAREMATTYGNLNSYTLCLSFYWLYALAVSLNFAKSGLANFTAVTFLNSTLGDGSSITRCSVA